MKLQQTIRSVVLLGFMGSAVCLQAQQCPSDEAKDTPDQILQYASPLNWTLLSLGGPTDLTVSGLSSVSSSLSFPARIGISAPGSLTLMGPSKIDGNILLSQENVTLNQSGPSYLGPVTQSADADRFLSLARQSALNGAYCASLLAPTLTVPGGSINIADPSGNITIDANDLYNVLKIQDLILSNGTVVLNSTYSASKPTLVINISGQFKLNADSTIVLQGSLDERHVLYNVIGTGENVAFSGGTDNTGTPTSQISGVLLAPLRNLDLSPGVVNGEVIVGGKQISIGSGGQIVNHLQIDR